MYDFWKVQDRRDRLNKAEAEGIVADSMTVRFDLLTRVQSGEITLHQAQEELKKIKKNAKKNGLVTREQVSRGYRPAIDAKEET